jgi:hypothetical protein
MERKEKNNLGLDGFASCYCRKRNVDQEFVVLGHETVDGQGYNTSENAANNAERSLP